MSVPYKNPISSVQVSTPQSVSRTSVFGTNFSTLNVGGYMEVYNLSDLSLTLTASSYPSLIQLSANTIPIRFTKGNNTFLSPDYLTLNSDNISSGRRRLGMLVYVHETDKVYQYVIPNYDTLWDNLSGLTGFSSVTYSDYTTVINTRSSAGQTFINSWTASTIEGVSGYTSTNANWRILQSGGGGTSGAYLPLSGGTVFGPTIFTSGVTANTISEVNYIDFKTSPTVPNPTGGTLYFDSNENALSYKPVTNQNDVTVNLGQESLIRIFNNLPYQINNGQVLHITGSTTTGGTPTVALANASKLGTAFTESLAQTSGVATHDIPSGQFGFMTNFGIVRDLNTSAFTAGQEIFLSDTVDGALTNDPNNISFTSRVSTVGYCLESSPTNGKILVVITNENPLQSLTQQEINVLLGNTISTGAYFYTGTTTASTTTINVSPVRGWIVYNTGINATNPLVLNVYYSGGTSLPVSGLTTSYDTYLLVNSGGTLYQTTSYPTPIERRQNIFLCRIVHPNKTTILNVEESVDFDVSPYSSLRDLWVPLKLINENVVPSPNGATLTFRTSSGTFWGNGIGFPTNELNPNSITVAAYVPASFYYTTQTGGTFTVTTTTVDTTNYDVGGVITNVPGSGNYTTQRIYMSQSGVIRLQYGQNYYPTLAKAIAAIPSETFVTNPDNALDCILIGLLTVKDGTGDLSNTDDAIFTFVSKFGDILGGTGGIATTTLQQAYNNSVPPEILTNSTLGALTIQNGTGSADNVSNLFEGLNTAGTITSFIRADGLISGSSVSAPTISATTISLPFSSGSTLFAGTSGQISQNNSQFFWDNVNNRFAIGTNTPVAKLDVIGTARISGTTSIVGDISQTNPSFTGTHTIGFSANNSVRFTNSGIGSYMQVGPSNVVDFLGQNLQSVQRGATFGNTIASTGIVSITAMAAQSSGVINSSAIQFTHAINNTGTYSGITRGIFYSPTLTSLVGTTHRAIETVTGDVVLGSTSGSVLIGKTTNDGFKLDVSGTTRLSALTQNVLTVIGSGNSTTSPIFSVQGSQGELFSVTDSLTGSLFSVNDISGLPILEVFSDNTTLMGNYLAPSLNTTARITLTAGTNTIYSIPVSAYTGAFFDYTVASTGTTGVRAGTIMSVWSGSTAEFTETSTNDIGITSGVTFSVISNGTLAQLRSSATTTGWIVKTIIRSI